MKKLFGVICALFFCHNVCANPVPATVQIRTDQGANGFLTFLNSVPQMVSGTIYQMAMLLSKLSSFPQNIQSALNSYMSLMIVAQSVGMNIQEAINNPNGTLGFKQLKQEVNTLVKAISTAVNATASVVDQTTAITLQSSLTQLMNAKDSLISELKSHSVNGQVLGQALSDSTFTAIEAAIQEGVDLVNKAANALGTVAAPYMS